MIPTADPRCTAWLIKACKVIPPAVKQMFCVFTTLWWPHCLSLYSSLGHMRGKKVNVDSPSCGHYGGADGAMTSLTWHFISIISGGVPTEDAGKIVTCGAEWGHIENNMDEDFCVCILWILHLSPKHWFRLLLCLYETGSYKVLSCLQQAALDLEKVELHNILFAMKRWGVRCFRLKELLHFKRRIIVSV